SSAARKPGAMLCVAKGRRNSHERSRGHAAELSALTWNKIDLTEGTVDLDGSMAKTRQRRIVKLSENTVAWLTDYGVAKPSFAHQLPAGLRQGEERRRIQRQRRRERFAPMGPGL